MQNVLTARLTTLIQKVQRISNHTIYYYSDNSCFRLRYLLDYINGRVNLVYAYTTIKF